MEIYSIIKVVIIHPEGGKPLSNMFCKYNLKKLTIINANAIKHLDWESLDCSFVNYSTKSLSAYLSPAFPHAHPPSVERGPFDFYQCTSGV